MFPARIPDLEDYDAQNLLIILILDPHEIKIALINKASHH